MMNQVSLTPSQTAVTGSTCSVLTSLGVIERLTPSTAWQKLLPKPSLPCLSAGVAVSVIGAPPRSIWNDSVRPALALTTRCMSEKLSMLAAVDRQHHIAGLEARPRRRRESGCTASTRAVVVCRPYSAKIAGEDHDRQDEIRDRPGGHDGGARAPPAGGRS